MEKVVRQTRGPMHEFTLGWGPSAWPAIRTIGAVLPSPYQADQARQPGGETTGIWLAPINAG